ncbi:hypothetical protein CsSME_00050502 [Camellia sinensis var. sinensis]
MTFICLLINVEIFNSLLLWNFCLGRCHSQEKEGEYPSKMTYSLCCVSFNLIFSCGSLPFCYASRSASPPDSRSPVRERRSRRSRSRSHDSDGASNPGNNLYVTGLSTRVTTSELEKYFNNEGKVTECHLVTDPRTKESRGFAFVTMETVEDAERCIKYLNHSVLEGRLITVEKVFILNKCM